MINAAHLFHLLKIFYIFINNIFHVFLTVRQRYMKNIYIILKTNEFKQQLVYEMFVRTLIPKSPLKIRLNFLTISNY